MHKKSCHPYGAQARQPALPTFRSCFRVVGACVGLAQPACILWLWCWWLCISAVSESPVLVGRLSPVAQRP